ncbi:MAG: S1 RNA-binding domain-containing protein [Pseudomonadota bacterium]
MSTEKRPEPGDVAFLKVVTVNNTGAFLDWGREKDLLLPYSEQQGRVAVDQYCLVIIQLDDDDRPFASMQLNDFIDDTVDTHDTPFKPGQRVHLVIADETDLGVKAVVDHRWWGLLYREDLFRPVRRGQSFEGHIKQQRADGKLDVTLNPPAHVAAASLGDRILETLAKRGGFLPLSDKSPPEDIQRTFGVSKGVFKQAIGALYKQRRIIIGRDGIRLPGSSGD